MTLRLFAHLRELAGTGRVEIDADHVGAVLEEACKRFGAGFADGLRSASIWIDGEPFEGGADQAVTKGSEVAIIPPVSGGSG